MIGYLACPMAPQTPPDKAPLLANARIAGNRRRTSESKIEARNTWHTEAKENHIRNLGRIPSNAANPSVGVRTLQPNSLKIRASAI